MGGSAGISGSVFLRALSQAYFAMRAPLAFGPARRSLRRTIVGLSASAQSAFHARRYAARPSLVDGRHARSGGKQVTGIRARTAAVPRALCNGAAARQCIALLHEA